MDQGIYPVPSVISPSDQDYLPYASNFTNSSAQLWNKYQSLLPKRHRQTIIYGHDSRRGLSISKYSKGLDTGCVKGGKLTALVIEERGKWYKKIRARTFSIRCRDYRARKEEAEPGQV